MNENMIFNLGGSGGAALNFKVVNNPKPENPKENTIWVNTDTEITGWQFASDDPNLLDFNNWANSISVQNGSKVVSGSSISLTASADDCYTNFGSGGVPIPCVAGRTYILEWEHSGANGEVYCFPSGGVDNLVMEGASAGKLEYTPTAGVTFFTFRIGVRTANTTATYSNIRITEKERAFKPGTVWIKTGTTSPVAMNVLKKNSIQVCPISAKQYVGGAWVDREAKSYQGGAWVDWTKFLYRDGTDYTELTGGWTTFDYTTFNGTPMSERLATFNNDHIWFENTTTYQSCNIRSQKMIDLTPFSKLCVEASIQAGKYFDVIVTSTTSAEVGPLVGIAQLRVGTAGDHTLQLDISSVAQSAYVVISTLRGEGGDANGRASVKKIWLA